MLKRISSRYAGKCRKCQSRHNAGDFVYWDRGVTGVLCDTCGRADSGSKPTPTTSPKPAVKSERKAAYDFTVDWSELKGLTQDVIAGNSPNWRSVNKEILEDNILRVNTGFHGYTVGQLERWLKSGYSTEAIQGLSEFTPPIRDKRKLIFAEEGDEIHLDLAWSGADEYFSEFTKHPNIPGVAIDAQLNFSAGVTPDVVIQYSGWLCQVIYSLESAGIDSEVTLYDRCRHMFQGESAETMTRIRVKKENEQTDFLSISPMLSPAAKRTFTFVADVLHAQTLGKTCSRGLGSPITSGWKVSYDSDSRRIEIGCDGMAREFPEAKMTMEFRSALAEIMRTEITN